MVEPLKLTAEVESEGLKSLKEYFKQTDVVDDLRPYGHLNLNAPAAGKAGEKANGR